MRKKLKKIWKWLRKNVLNRQMILPAIIAEIIFWIPVWIPAILAVTISEWWWTVTSATIVFWAGPFTPAIPLQLALILFVKKIIDYFNRSKKQNDKSKQQDL